MMRMLRGRKVLVCLSLAFMMWHIQWSLTFATQQAFAGVTPPRTSTSVPSTAPPLSSQAFQFDDLLLELKDILAKAEEQAEDLATTGLPDYGKFQELQEKLQTEQQKVEEHLAQQEEFLRDKGLSQEILNRQLAFTKLFGAKYRTLFKNLEAIEVAHGDTTSFYGRFRGKRDSVDWESVLGDTLAFLDENTPKPRESHFDPKNLPHRSLKADKPIPPKLTREAWLKAFPPEKLEKGPLLAKGSEPQEGQPVLLANSSASPESLAEPLGLSTAPDVRQVQNSPNDAPSAADLAETIEVQFTSEITQLAADLDNNPVKIFNWVRNNIEFVPIWGSIQGAQLCLEVKTCNAFDTASLLIALYRVSGIPARYQMGTIEVPVESAMNWLGGFTDPAAAARFVASGGTPSAGTVEENGEILSIRMEHIWVRAFVDFIPSQGGVDLESDLWIGLDPSFKIYDFSLGVDPTTLTSFDTNAFFPQLETSTQINISEGSIIVDSSNAQIVQEAFNNILRDLQITLSSENLEEALHASLPFNAIVDQNLSIATAGSPYPVLAFGPIFTSLPSELRHSLTISLTNNAGSELLNFRFTLPEIGSRSLSLYYAPATQNDIDIINATIPQDLLSDPEPGTVIQRLIQRIPAQLVNVKPLIQIDGNTKSTGNPIGMGDSYTLNARFSAPTVATVDARVETFAWGRYGIAVDLGGISKKVFENGLAANKRLFTEFTPGDPVEPIASTSSNVIVSSWFHQVDRWSKALGNASGVAFGRYPSLGYSYIPMSVVRVFGISTHVSIEGYVLDVAQQLHIISALDGQEQTERAWAMSIGLLSSLLEGKILANFFSGPDSNRNGISASSTIAAALDQGIPVQTIYQRNLSATLPGLDNDYDKEAIRNWVNAGRAVIIPKQSPLVDGQATFGYVAIDPATGDGAYIVENARAGWVRAVCRDDARDFRDCETWFVNLVDLVGIISGVVLATIGITFAIVGATAGLAAITAYIPNITLYLIALKGAQATSIITLVDCVLEKIGPIVDLDPEALSCLSALLSFVKEQLG